MSARDFIENTLLVWLDTELSDNPLGNKAFIAGFEAAVKAMSDFINQNRNQWDVEE